MPVCPGVMKAAAAVSENRAAEPHSFVSTQWKQGVHTIVKSGGGDVSRSVAHLWRKAFKVKASRGYTSNIGLHHTHLLTRFTSHDVCYYLYFL